MSSLLIFLSYALMATAASSSILKRLSRSTLQSPPSSPKQIFILAGQSNMAGEGGVVDHKWDGIVPPQCQPNPKILRLNEGLKWEQAHEPLSTNGGVGPGMAFANAVLKNEPSFGVVGLVPCAVGMSTIRQWAKGGRLYDLMVKRAVAALEDGGSVRALLWYQGESETAVKEAAALYEDRVNKFFTNVRADLNNSGLPILQVALASAVGPYIEEVRHAQLSVCKELENVKCVDAKGLPLGPDTVHLTTPAQVQLGEMLASAFLQS